MTYGITACWPIFNNGYIKSQRVYEIYWITLNIAICIQYLHQPNRITLRITSAFRVISTVVIIEQAAFAVVVLARKAQGVGGIAEALRVAVGQVDSEGVEVVPAPAQLVVVVDNLPWRVQVVAEHVVNAAAAADDRDRSPSQMCSWMRAPSVSYSPIR